MKKLLFTPGPLSTSAITKEAMLQDVGSRDYEFIEAVKDIRNELLKVGHVSQNKGYECVIIQGSGTFGIESVISSSIGRQDTLLVLVNGAYGERIVKMAQIHQINTIVERFEEDELVTTERTESALKNHPTITHVAVIHSETTTGLVNPIEEIGKIVKAHNKTYIVDAMSSFGGIETDVAATGADFLVSSSNKCIEGVPGFAFAICKRGALEKCKGQARTLTLDLYEQWKGLETNGQFRFTPPTLSLMAFRQALRELEAEGGVPAREARYRKNKAILDAGMQKLGLKAYLKPELQGPIISSFLYPSHPNFNFEHFYQQLNQQGLVIYPGKLSKADAFRIGTIGQIFPEDVERLVEAIGEALKKL